MKSMHRAIAVIGIGLLFTSAARPQQQVGAPPAVAKENNADFIKLLKEIDMPAVEYFTALKDALPPGMSGDDVYEALRQNVFALNSDFAALAKSKGGSIFNISGVEYLEKIIKSNPGMESARDYFKAISSISGNIKIKDHIENPIQGSHGPMGPIIKERSERETASAFWEDAQIEQDPFIALLFAEESKRTYEKLNLSPPSQISQFIRGKALQAAADMLDAAKFFYDLTRLSGLDNKSKRTLYESASKAAGLAFNALEKGNLDPTRDESLRLAGVDPVQTRKMIDDIERAIKAYELLEKQQIKPEKEQQELEPL